MTALRFRENVAQACELISPAIEPTLTNLAVHEASEHEIAQAFELHRGRLLRLANARCNSREDAEDLVQLCFMRALEQRERLPTGRRLEAWLFTAVQRAAVDLWRRKRTRSETTAKAPHAAESVEASPQDLPSWSHISTEQLVAAMRACPPWMQQVFEMYYTHNLSCREIGQRLRISESTVATRLHRARVRVRVCLERTLSTSFEHSDELAVSPPPRSSGRHCESAPRKMHESLRGFQPRASLVSENAAAPSQRDEYAMSDSKQFVCTTNTTPKARVVHAQPMDALGEVVRASVSEVTAVKHLAASERVFKGHFPHYPVMPGVMLLEAMVQAVRWQAAEQGWRLRLIAIDSVRWNIALRPGSTYETSCKFADQGSVTKVSTRITADGHQVATCSSRWSMEEESC